MKSVIGIALGIFVLAAVWAPTTHAACSCAGGTPTTLTFQSTIGSGSCGHLDADGNPNFYQLACGGLYFGGAGVGLPLPATLPDNTSSIINVSSCVGNTLTLTNSTSGQTGSNRTCTSTNCLFGGPLSIPNVSHNGAATSTCVINVVSSNANGAADCSTGATTLLNVPLSSNIYLTGDLLPNRCSTDGSGCATIGAKCGPALKGKCVQDTGRCKGGTTPPAGTPCVSDSDCDGGAGATCETGQCLGGSNHLQGCITAADCASTPLGGDDTGCIPGSKNMLKCGDGILKAAGKLASAEIKCHIKQEQAAFAAGSFDEEPCETFDPIKHKSAKEVFDAAIAKLRSVCTPGQLVGANSIRDTILGGVDLGNGLVFCEGTTAIDPTGDDAGKIPTTAASKKCEETFASNAAKLAASVIACHVKSTDAKFGNKVFDEEACEEIDSIKHKGAHEVFTAAVAKSIASGVCTDPCQDAPHQEVLALALIGTAETVNASAYPCPVCDPLVQPCPICSPVSHTCAGGPNDSMACTPADTFTNDSYPTSHDCPPGAGNLGALPIGFALTSGTSQKVATDLPDQVNVFCGFCRNKITNAFKNPAVPCTSNTDCSAVTGFTSCGQRTSGAFSSLDVARTIVGTGTPAGALTTGGTAKSTNLVSVFCIPPTFNTLVDSSADLPGPGFSDLPGLISIQ